MPRPSTINNKLFRKTPDSGTSLRDRLYAFAQDGEVVADLIKRAEEAGLGTEKQIRLALYLGERSQRAKFRLEDPNDETQGQATSVHDAAEDQIVDANNQVISHENYLSKQAMQASTMGEHIVLQLQLQKMIEEVIKEFEAGRRAST